MERSVGPQATASKQIQPQVALEPKVLDQLRRSVSNLAVSDPEEGMAEEEMAGTSRRDQGRKPRISFGDVMDIHPRRRGVGSENEKRCV